MTFDREALIPFAKYIWRKTPDEFVAFQERLLAQFMKLCDWDDVCAFVKLVSDDAMAIFTMVRQRMIDDMRIRKPSFVQFAVNSYLPAGLVGNNIAKATLKVFVNSVKATGSFNVYAVSSAWTEAGINATSQPAVGAQLVGPIAISNASSQKWISIDITN